jgi:hypothetical protein
MIIIIIYVIIFFKSDPVPVPGMKYIAKYLARICN